MTEARERKHLVVKRHLLDLIGELQPGASVPTERDLALELDTSRTTVREALRELVAEGRLVRRQGSGTYVAEPKLAWPLQMSSFTEQAAAAGVELVTELIGSERIAATQQLALALDLAPGARVHRIERLRLVNGLPMALEQSHLSASRFVGLAAALRKSSSLYTVLRENYGVTVADAVQTIETEPASPRVAKLLDTDVGAPVLSLSRHSLDSSGQPVEWVQAWYRGDRYKFVARLVPSAPTRDPG